MIVSADPEAAEVDANGHVGPRMLLSAGLVPQEASSAATIPGALLVAWLEYPHEDGAPTLRLGRFGADGAPFEEPITVAAADARKSAMAARGNDALIVWQTGNDNVNAAIVRQDGTLQAVPLPALSGTPAVAASRSGWMIVVAQTDALTAIRVDATGAASPPQTLVSLPFMIPDAAVASDGDRFLVVWSTSAICNAAPCGTRANLLDATGGVLASGLPISPIHLMPSATFAGGEYFVAANNGVRLNRDGNRIGDVAVHATRIAPFGNAVLAWDGARLVVIDRGVVGAETAFDKPPVLAPTAVVYNVDVAGESAVAFRQILTERRRTAYH